MDTAPDKEIKYETLSETVHKYRVFTHMRILLRLRTLLKTLGLENLLNSGKLESGDLVNSAMALLQQSNLLNEFCQTVTDSDRDFMEEEIGTVMWVIHDFFLSMFWQMPPSWRQALQKSIAALVELGKAEIANQVSNIGGMTPDNGLTVSD